MDTSVKCFSRAEDIYYTVVINKEAREYVSMDMLLFSQYPWKPSSGGGALKDHLVRGVMGYTPFKMNDTSRISTIRFVSFLSQKVGMLWCVRAAQAAASGRATLAILLELSDPEYLLRLELLEAL